MLLSIECFRWFAFLPLIPFKIWNEALQPAFLALSSQNIFSLRSFYFQQGKNEVYVEIHHSHYSTPKAEWKWPHHTHYIPQGVHNHAKNVPPAKPSRDDQRQRESSDCVSQSREEDEDICQRSSGREMTHPMEIKDIRVFILNGKETHILVAPLASEIMD